MPPSLVGASMHSMRRIGSGMSKWTPAISSMVRSASSCIQPRNASRPWILRDSSASRCTTASAYVAPGTIRSDVTAMSSESRLSSSQPHA